jgi:hypothetical protein
MNTDVDAWLIYEKQQSARSISILIFYHVLLFLPNDDLHCKDRAGHNLQLFSPFNKYPPPFTHRPKEIESKDAILGCGYGAGAVNIKRSFNKNSVCSF